MHFIPSLSQTSDTKWKNNCWSSDPYEQFCPTGLFGFSITEIRPKRWNAPRDKQKAQMVTMALSTQDKHRETRLSVPVWPWWATRPMGTQTKISVPCVDRRDTGGKTDWCVLCKQPSHWQRECPRCQWVMGAPWPLMVSQSEDWQGPRPEVALCRDGIYIRKAEPRVVIEMVGKLIEFLIYTGATFLVLTQRIENFNNCKKYLKNIYT